ncbi:MAG TPA: hypothetical protein VJ778_09840 [Burkholderiales bacterium]|nr:hypothetical protein [Burkholderiales bacterium]
MQVIFALIMFSMGPVLSVLAAGTDWAKGNLAKSERLLCQRKVAGEHFFLALAGDKVKVGSRLDMTGYSEAHVYTIAWIFQNEKDDSLVAKVPPKAVKQRYTQSADKIFAENVEYQTLAIGQSKTVRVAIEIRKCAGPECGKTGESKRDKKYDVDMCTLKASEFLPR